MSVNQPDAVSQTDSSRMSSGSGSALKVKLVQSKIAGLQESLAAQKAKQTDLEFLKSFINQGFWLKILESPDENVKRRKYWFECSHLGSSNVLYESEPINKKILAWDEEI